MTRTDTTELPPEMVQAATHSILERRGYANSIALPFAAQEDAQADAIAALTAVGVGEMAATLEHLEYCAKTNSFKFISEVFERLVEARAESAELRERLTSEQEHSAFLQGECDKAVDALYQRNSEIKRQTEAIAISLDRAEIRARLVCYSWDIDGYDSLSYDEKQTVDDLTDWIVRELAAHRIKFHEALERLLAEMEATLDAGQLDFMSSPVDQVRRHLIARLDAVMRELGLTAETKPHEGAE